MPHAGTAADIAGRHGDSAHSGQSPARSQAQTTAAQPRLDLPATNKTTRSDTLWRLRAPLYEWFPVADSLQDQLIKAGLVSEDQVNRARAPKKQKRKPNPRPARKRPAQQAAVEDLPAVEQRPAPKTISSRPAKKAFDWREAKAQKAQAGELIKKHKLNQPAADIRHNFAKGNRVKQVYVTAQQRDDIIGGRLAIAIADDRAYVIPLETAAKLRTLSPKTFVLVNEQQQTRNEADPYVGYEVPDDLHW